MKFRRAALTYNSILPLVVVHLFVFSPNNHAAEVPTIITNLVVRNNQFEFSVIGSTNQACQVQASDNLAGSWTDLDFEHSVSVPLDRDTRFFRTKCGEVFSANVAGWITLSIPPGYSMIANPLVGPTNTVEALFQGVPDGMALYFFQPGFNSYSANVFAFGEWLNPGQTLMPGEGAFIHNPATTNVSIIFMGEVYRGPIPAIPKGWSIRSCPIPQPSEFCGFAATEGLVLFRFNNAIGNYIIYAYELGEWSSHPSINIGEAFFVLRPN